MCDIYGDKCVNSRITSNYSTGWKSFLLPDLRTNAQSATFISASTRTAFVNSTNELNWLGRCPHWRVGQTEWESRYTTRTSESIVSYSRDSIQARGHSLRQIKVSQWERREKLICGKIHFPSTARARRASGGLMHNAWSLIAKPETNDFGLVNGRGAVHRVQTAWEIC